MDRYKIPAALYILISITFISISPCLCNGFTLWDDNRFITENKIVRDISPRNIKTMFTSAVCENYAPLAVLSYAVEYRIAGTDDPFIYHADNLILHLANCLLAFWFIYLISGSAAVSFVTALLFGVHPMHVESVAWISERKDVLSAFFGLLTLGAYARYARHPGTLRMAVTCVLFALGLMAKPMLVTLPATLLLLDYWPLRRLNTLGEFHRRITEKLPLIALAIVSCAITFAVQDSGG